MTKQNALIANLKKNPQKTNEQKDRYFAVNLHRNFKPSG